MATLEILMTPDNLKANILDGSFGKTAHKFYVIYDDLMDEFIAKLTQPETLVVEFPISDYYSLLVEPQTFEVVGFQWSEFTTQHLPKMEQLSKIWDEKNVAEHFSQYREITYQPNRDLEANRESYFFVRPEKIDRALATA